LHTRLRVHWAPGIPRALCFQGEGFMHNSDASRRGIAELCLELRHCEERSDEAIHSFFVRRNGLLRFARNDGLKHRNDHIVVPAKARTHSHHRRLE
jgi:hypothetical protein